MLVVTGKADMATLGILITTNGHATYAREIVHAACDKGHRVRIHLTGPGVKIVGNRAFDILGDWARITICRHSAEQLGLADNIQGRYPHMLTTDEGMADIIVGCDRHLVL